MLILLRIPQSSMLRWIRLKQMHCALLMLRSDESTPSLMIWRHRYRMMDRREASST